MLRNEESYENIVSPVSTIGLFLKDEAVASAWYHHYISGPAMQTLFGSIEGLSADGDKVTPLARWSTKSSVVLAMLGGVRDLVSRKLVIEGKSSRFLNAIP